MLWCPRLLRDSRNVFLLRLHRSFDLVKEGLVKEIDTTVDQARDPLFRLFDVMQDLGGFRIVNDTSVSRRRLFGYLSH